MLAGLGATPEEGEVEERKESPSRGEEKARPWDVVAELLSTFEQLVGVVNIIVLERHDGFL